MDAGRWSVVRTESARILDALLRAPLLDSDVPETRTRLAGLMAGGLDDKERALAAQLIGPLVVGNSSFSQELTDQETAKARAAVQPVMVSILQGEKIVSVRRADHDRRDGEDQRARAQDLEAGRRELRRLVPDGRPDRRLAARLAVAVPADALASRQRPGPDRAPRRRRDARPQGHRRTLDPPVLPADRGHRHAARDPARRVARDRRHRPHRGHRRRRQRRLARDDDLRPPRRAGRHRR